MDPHPKPKTPKDPVYLDRIRHERCLVCGRPAEPHHMRGIERGNDYCAVPLCRVCHTETHSDQRFLYLEGLGDRWVLVWIIKSLAGYISQWRYENGSM